MNPSDGQAFPELSPYEPILPRSAGDLGRRIRPGQGYRLQILPRVFYGEAEPQECEARAHSSSGASGRPVQKCLLR
jgi:hypothetical protein